MNIIKNRLAASLLEASGPAREEVMAYLTRLAEIEELEDTQALQDFEKNHRSSNLRVEWFCVITNQVNRRPFFTMCGFSFLIYNVLWAAILLARKVV
jgi:hypothetical protein